MKRGSVVFGIKIALLAVVDFACIALLFYPRSELVDGLFPWMVANILLALFYSICWCWHCRSSVPICGCIRLQPPILIALLYFVFTPHVHLS